MNNAPPPIDTTPPTVSITNPTPGATVSGTTTDTMSPYSASWNTTTATNGTHSLTAKAFDAANNQATSAAVSVTVNNGSRAVLDITMSGVPSSIPRGQFFTATATVTNTGSASASGHTVLVTFAPSNSMRLENPQNSSQALPTVAPGGSQSVSWLIRGDNQATGTLTFTLRNSSGATVDTVSQAITITN